jgi:hypothetical protein
VVGLTTGDTYRFSGPLTQTNHGSTDPVSGAEFTIHNVNHFVGPGQASDILFRTLIHVTFDPATGAVKAEIFEDEVLCHGDAATATATSSRQPPRARDPLLELVS